MCVYHCAPVEIRGKLSEADSSLGIQALNSGGQLSSQTALQAKPLCWFCFPLEYVRLERSSQTGMRSTVIYFFVKTTSQYRKSCAHNYLEISSDALSIEKLE